MNEKKNLFGIDLFRIKISRFIILLFLILTSLYCFSNYQVQNKGSEILQYASPLISEKTSYLLNNRDDINRLFIGSSKTFNNINPNVIDSLLEDNKISYNYGIPGMWPVEYKRILELVVDSLPNLNILICEVAPFDNRSFIQSDNHNTSRVLYHYSITKHIGTLWPYSIKGVYRFFKEISSILKLSINKIIFNLNYLLKRKKKYNVFTKKTKLNGYSPLAGCNNYPRKYRIQQKNYSKETWQRSLFFFEQLSHLAHRKRIKLYFHFAPFTDYSWINKSYFLNKNILGIRSIKDSDNLFNREMMFDQVHLNGMGAVFYSQILANQLLERH